MSDLARARRWPWFVAAAVVLTAGLVSAAMLLGPALACRAVQAKCPLDLGHQYVLESVTTTAPSSTRQMTVILSPARARRFADSMDGVWLPPGLLRPGLSAEGTGHLPRDLVPFTWTATVAERMPRPTASLRLTRDQANDLFDPYRRFPIDRERDMFFSYVIRDASVRDDDQPGQGADERRLRVDASGEMCFEWGRWRHRMPVRHLTGHLLWTFTPVPGGLRPVCRMTIDRVDADLPHVPFVPSWDQFWRRIEASADRSFAKHLSKRVIPSGSPIDATIDGVIGDGVANDDAGGGASAASPTPAREPRIAGR